MGTAERLPDSRWSGYDRGACGATTHPRSVELHASCVKKKNNKFLVHYYFTAHRNYEYFWKLFGKVGLTRDETFSTFIPFFSFSSVNAGDKGKKIIRRRGRVNENERMSVWCKCREVEGKKRKEKKKRKTHRNRFFLLLLVKMDFFFVQTFEMEITLLWRTFWKIHIAFDLELVRTFVLNGNEI